MTNGEEHDFDLSAQGPNHVTLTCMQCGHEKTTIGTRGKCNVCGQPHDWKTFALMFCVVFSMLTSVFILKIVFHLLQNNFCNIQ